MRAKKTVALLFGGRSSEHGISCVTAAGVFAAIDKTQFEVVPVGIAKNGQFVPIAVSELQSYKLDTHNMPEVKPCDESIIWPTSTQDRTLRVLQNDGCVRELAKIDVVLPMLHGPYGEDGTVQGLCELISLPYVGSGVLGSALCMDKHAVKTVLRQAGVPVADWSRITKAQYLADPAVVSKLDAGLAYPLFVKPARAGSSVGVTKVAHPQDLEEAVRIALDEDSSAIIESAVVGREVEIAVLQEPNGLLKTSEVIGEIVFNGREFYDFEAKYLGGSGADVVLPAAVTAQELKDLKDNAIAAFNAADCAGYARVDFFLTANGPVLNEINTLPGFTPISMYPKLWEASGLSYSELITALLAHAVTAQRAPTAAV